MKGDRLDDDNVFKWENMILDLPGLDLYDPSLPWVYKVREDGSITTDHSGISTMGDPLLTPHGKLGKRLGK